MGYFGAGVCVRQGRRLFGWTDVDGRGPYAIGLDDGGDASRLNESQRLRKRRQKVLSLAVFGM